MTLYLPSSNALAKYLAKTKNRAVLSTAPFHFFPSLQSLSTLVFVFKKSLYFLVSQIKLTG